MTLHRPSITRPAAAVGLAVGALLWSAAPAAAHVGIQQSEVVAGQSATIGFTVPHGCDGSPTTAVSIQIPDAINSITPDRHPLYDLTVETEPLDEPVEGSHGEQITERDAVVTYTAREPLPDGIRDVLTMSVAVSADAAGQTLYFPTVQTCEEGEAAWIEIAGDGVDPHSLDSPAPSVAVVAGDGTSGHDHGHGEGEHDAADDEAVGDDDIADADADATDDGEDEAVVAEANGDDGGTDALTIVALALGVIGVGTGGAALVASRRSGPTS